jgi:signal transduction histidine kinase
VSRYSIRWRLSLSYAAIALLATLALGSVLLLTLRGHYLRVEHDYVQSNAQAISLSLAQLLEGDPSPEALQSQLDSFAFLSNAYVRLLDAEQELVATADPGTRIASALQAARIGEALEAVGRVMEALQSGAVPTSTLATEDGAPVWIPADQDGRSPLPQERRQIVPWLLQRDEERAGGGTMGTRSSQVALVPIYGSANQLLGYVELSQGPAYAREILEDVAWGLGIAGVVAVALAAVVGWAISRRISDPLVALTEVTGAMDGGDLSARADVARKDELGTLARSFNQMADRVEEIITTLRRFVSDAAHEIHTPLTALHTNLELAQRDAAAGSEEHVLAAQAQVERLEALTGGLLELSRLESPVQAPQLVPVSLQPLVQEAGELYASRAEQAGLAFELSTPEAPVSVLGDEGELMMALSNLLDNALKFTPEGGQIALGFRQEGNSAILWVEDTGPGMPEEDLPHLFDRFYRGRSAATYPGSGLGLAIVQAIVDRHEGWVKAENMERGARFTIRIPTCPKVG